MGGARIPGVSLVTGGIMWARRPLAIGVRITVEAGLGKIGPHMMGIGQVEGDIVLPHLFMIGKNIGMIVIVIETTGMIGA